MKFVTIAAICLYLIFEVVLQVVGVVRCDLFGN